MRLPGFIGPSYTLRSVNAAFQRSLNLYPEQNEMSPTNWTLTHTPGLRLLSAVGSGPIRGMFRAENGRAFAVSGSSLYEITAPLVPVLLGTLQTSVGKVAMADNTTQLIIVDGVKGYVLTFATSVLAVIADSNFPVASSVAFLDQYILANDADSGRFQYSALNDATNWDGLDVATAEGSPDNLIALAVDHREVILFGDTTTEVWFNTGDALNPFQRRNGAFIEHGIAGKYLHSLLDNTRLWWSKDADGQAVAMRMNGYQGERISTFAIERAVQGYGDISEGSCWSYQDSGHTFWITNFPGASVSWVYDVATGLWHERCYFDAVNGQEKRHRAENHIYHSFMHIVGDYQNGNIYALDPDTYTDNGDYIVKQRVWPGIEQEGARVFYESLELDTETGVGPEVALLDGDGHRRAPVAMLEISNDGGHKWGSQRTASIGQSGDRKERVNWSRLGAGRRRVFKLTITDPVPVTIKNAWVDVTVGAH